MDTTSWKEFKFSRMMVGTVQFGMPYGVANRTGQPQYRDALAIVAAAIEGGVHCFDTASAYGTSEEVLGRALQELRIADRVTIVTKVRPLTVDELADSALAERAIERSVEQSRDKLRLDRLPIVLFHREQDAAYGYVLESLHDRGRLQYWGVSCGNFPESAAQFASGSAASSGLGPAALQLPGSILDRRHQHANLYAQASHAGQAVFLRSVYLQGLLIMPEDEIPSHLREVVPIRRQLLLVATEAGLTLPELAVRYMLSQAGITSVLTGIETIQQLNENLAIFEKGALSCDLLEKVDKLAMALPEMVITPALWPKC